MNQNRLFFSVFDSLFLTGPCSLGDLPGEWEWGGEKALECCSCGLSSIIPEIEKEFFFLKAKSAS